MCGEAEAQNPRRSTPRQGGREVQTLTMPRLNSSTSIVPELSLLGAHQNGGACQHCASCCSISSSSPVQAIERVVYNGVHGYFVHLFQSHRCPHVLSKLLACQLSIAITIPHAGERQQDKGQWLVVGGVHHNVAMLFALYENSNSVVSSSDPRSSVLRPVTNSAKLSEPSPFASNAEKYACVCVVDGEFALALLCALCGRAR